MAGYHQLQVGGPPPLLRARGPTVFLTFADARALSDTLLPPYIGTTTCQQFVRGLEIVSLCAIHEPLWSGGLSLFRKARASLTQSHVRDEMVCYTSQLEKHPMINWTRSGHVCRVLAFVRLWSCSEPGMPVTNRKAALRCCSFGNLRSGQAPAADQKPAQPETRRFQLGTRASKNGKAQARRVKHRRGHSALKGFLDHMAQHG